MEGTLNVCQLSNQAHEQGAREAVAACFSERIERL